MATPPLKYLSQNKFPYSQNLHKFFQQNNFAKVFIHGRLYHFGIIQAKVIEQLYAASLTNSPWVCGKELLYQAGSKSIALRELFKSQTNWQQLIESDRKGSYRLRLL